MAQNMRAALNRCTGGSGCKIWIASKVNGKPRIVDFVTGCKDLPAARAYLEETKHIMPDYGIFSWEQGKWLE